MTQEYEWGVWSNVTDEIHRLHMTEREARAWLQSWREDAELMPSVQDMFSLCKRPIGEWEVE